MKQMFCRIYIPLNASAEYYDIHCEAAKTVQNFHMHSLCITDDYNLPPNGLMIWIFAKSDYTALNNCLQNIPWDSFLRSSVGIHVFILYNILNWIISELTLKIIKLVWFLAEIKSNVMNKKNAHKNFKLTKSITSPI